MKTTQMEAADPIFKVTEVMSQLVMSGVMSFCLTAFLSFLRGLYLVYEIVVAKKTVQDEGSVPSMLTGAGLIASTVAIGNVVNVEVSFHTELHLFNPGAKFWSTKIIVSIAFIQEFVLGLLGNERLRGENKLSDLQIKLLYCSLLCYEVLGVTLLHVIAWPAKVNITAEEKEKAIKEGKQYDDVNVDRTEYWEEEAAPHHAVHAREPLLCVE